MLKFIYLNKEGVVSWLLSQIALLLATAILLMSIASLTFYSDWQKEAEAKAVASEIATMIEIADLKTAPNSTIFMLPQKKFSYDAYLSTDYVIVIRTDGRIKKEIKEVEALIIKPHIRIDYLNHEWYTGEELHQWLKEVYGHSGESIAPLPYQKKTDVESLLESELEETAKNLALNPLHLDVNKPLVIEKTFIYFEKEGKEEKNLESMGLVIVYQSEE